MCDAAGNEAWSYDKMGRVAIDQRTTNGITKPTTYAYNFDGSTATLSYPSLRTITYTPNIAAQLVTAKDTAYNINYAVGPATCPNGQPPSPSGTVCYTPQGTVARLVNGSNLTTTSYYNNRLQPCRIAVNSSGTAPGSCGDGTNYGNVLDYTYNFNLGTSDDGDVIAITNNLTKNTPSTDRSQSFTYDPLNRIATAGTVSTSGANCRGEQYGYDAWGNLLSMSGITPQYNGCSQESGFSITVTNSNQIAGFCYDAAGNLLAQSAPPCPSPTYTYNAENQLTSTAGVTYTYDGDGKRVEKSNGKLYWYGMGSDALDESDASGNLTDEYIFFGGKRIARRDSSGNVDYYFADHLGTARVVVTATGTLQDDSDFYPFGVERPVLSSSGNTYKFTGKERDNESGLDNFGARYDSSQYGRFMTPDWSAKPMGVPYAQLGDPQSLNLYSYVENNPLGKADPDGHCGGLCAILNFFFSTANDAAAPPPPPPPPGEMEEFTSTRAPAQSQQNGQNQPNSQQPQQTASWHPSKPLPGDPSMLGPDWKKNPGYKNPNGEEYINDKTGEKIEWNKGRPGPWGPKADRGKDGWHFTPPGGTRGKQLDPGQVVKSVGGALAIGAAIHVIVETAPEWGPWVGGALAF